jgi:hypothetical protein
MQAFTQHMQQRTLPATFRRARHGRVNFAPVARLFTVTRLYSHEPRVAVETAPSSEADGLRSVAAELAASSIVIEATAQADSIPTEAPHTTSNNGGSNGSGSAIPALFYRPGSRAAMQARAGRKLLFASPRTLGYLDGRWAEQT